MLILEYCSGGDLEKLIETRKEMNLPFSNKKIFDMICQISDGIQYCHNLKCPILHNDLKPENIFISMDTYKIADFGSSL